MADKLILLGLFHWLCVYLSWQTTSFSCIYFMWRGIYLIWQTTLFSCVYFIPVCMYADNVIVLFLFHLMVYLFDLSDNQIMCDDQ